MRFIYLRTRWTRCLISVYVNNNLLRVGTPCGIRSLSCTVGRKRDRRVKSTQTPLTPRHPNTEVNTEIEHKKKWSARFRVLKVVGGGREALTCAWCEDRGAGGTEAGVRCTCRGAAMDSAAAAAWWGSACELRGERARWHVLTGPRAERDWRTRDEAPGRSRCAARAAEAACSPRTRPAPAALAARHCRCLAPQASPAHPLLLAAPDSYWLHHSN